MTYCELTAPRVPGKVAAIGGNLYCLILLANGGEMKMKSERLSRIALWRISLAGLFLLGTLVADSLTDWSAPVNLGPTINAASAEQ